MVLEHGRDKNLFFHYFSFCITLKVTTLYRTKDHIFDIMEKTVSLRRNFTGFSCNLDSCEIPVHPQEIQQSVTRQGFSRGTYTGLVFGTIQISGTIHGGVGQKTEKTVFCF